MHEQDDAPLYRAVTRLYIDGDLFGGAAITLDRSRAHYLRHVLRQGDGAVINIFNGRDGEWRASLGSRGSQSILLVEQQSLPQPALQDLMLIFAPIRGHRLDNIIEKATELGVLTFQPVLTDHTQLRRLNLERLQAQTIEAAEQSLRLDVPAIAAPVTLKELLEQWSDNRHILLCAEAGRARPIHDILAAGDQDSCPTAIMTGPEGGFSKSELDLLAKLPFVTPASLGPRILRADTAAVAALSCWQSVRGDWSSRPPFRTTR